MIRQKTGEKRGLKRGLEGFYICTNYFTIRYNGCLLTTKNGKRQHWYHQQKTDADKIALHDHPLSWLLWIGWADSRLSGADPPPDSMKNTIEEALSEPIELNEVVVRGDRRRNLQMKSPQNITVVDKSYIEDHFSGSLMQSLEKIPGVRAMVRESGSPQLPYSCSDL